MTPKQSKKKNSESNLETANQTEVKENETMPEETTIETPEVKSGPEVKPISVKVLKPKQTYLDLDTMADAEVQLVYNEYGINPSADFAAVMDAAKALCQPEVEQVKAFIRYANGKAYQDAKTAALAKGNYMSQALRSALTDIMSKIDAFSERKAGENFTYWQEAFTATDNPSRQAKARKLLDRARQQIELSEFADM